MTSDVGLPVAQVLIVDDEPGIRRFAARVLEEEGYGVLLACDGAEALELLGSPGTTPHVVVTDIVMPRLNGLGLLEQLARSYPRLPVLLMSGYTSADLLSMGLAAPCGFLAKPFSPEQLLAEVRRCLSEPMPEVGTGGE